VYLCRRRSRQDGTWRSECGLAPLDKTLWSDDGSNLTGLTSALYSPKFIPDLPLRLTPSKRP
jgi:hypothetical protein